MKEITLEDIDILRSRFGISYNEAKEILEKFEGNVIDALIYLEKIDNEKEKNTNINKDEIINTIKKIIEKGNATRIKIKKDDEIILDIPLTGVIATGAITALYPKLLAIITVTCAITVVASKLTIEITKEDGSVEIINKTIKKGMNTAKETVCDFAEDIKESLNEIKSGIKSNVSRESEDEHVLKSNTYSYKVNFEN